MDLCVVAALIDQHDLFGRANNSFSLLTGTTTDVLVPQRWNAPKSIAPQCSFLRSGKSWVVAASGGIQIESFRIATNVETNSAIQQVRDQAGQGGENWWWN
jgi:hypothetical protein